MIKRRLTTTLLLVAGTFSTTTSANIWREIEVVVFQQLSGQDSLREIFPVDIEPVDIRGTGDFISRVIQPDVKTLRDALPVCFAEPVTIEEQYPLPSIQVTLGEDDELLNGSLDLESNFATNQFVQVSADGYYSDGIDDRFYQPRQPVTQQQANADPFSADSNGVDNDFSDSNTTDRNYSETVTQVNTLESLAAPVNEPDVEIIAAFEPIYQNPTTANCVFENELAYLPSFSTADTVIEAAQVPTALFAPDIGDALSHLRTDEHAQLKEVVKNIRRSRNMRVMLHTMWRQNIRLGKAARSYRLFAGENFSDRFHYNGLAVGLPEFTLAPQPDTAAAVDIDDNNDFMTQLRSAIDNAGPHLLAPEVADKPIIELPRDIAGQPQQVWQLDGKFNLYLKRVNRVPYMFIEWNMDYRQAGTVPEKYLPLYQVKDEPLISAEASQSPSGETASEAEFVNQYLYAYKFKQSRRLISNEVHYFDHPYFGIIMQIRRFQPDTPTESNE
jgi:hypothetical protein